MRAKVKLIVITMPMLQVFEWSLTTGSIPFLFKMSTVKPVFKRKGDKSSVSNYQL